MKILLMSIGTRGDCEPFLGLAKILRDKGDEIVCAFPEQHRHLALSEGYEFISLGSSYLDMLDMDFAKAAMGGDNKIKQIIATIKLAKQSLPIQYELMDMQKKAVDDCKPDYVIFHTKAVYPIAWHIKTKKPIAMFSTIPCNIHEVEGFSHVGMNFGKSKFMQSLSYKIGAYGFAQAAVMTGKRHFKGEVSSDEIKRFIPKMKILYNVSPCVLPTPKSWSDNLKIGGFLERDKTKAFSPSEELTEFLEKHDKVLMLSFGSAVNTKPLEITKMFVEIFADCKIPAIINISGEGLSELGESFALPDSIIFQERLPYDWIFPKIHAVIHHGGAGVTNCAIKSGCANMAIPHSADQPMWDMFIEKLGVGPRGLAISKLNKQVLKEKIIELYANENYKKSSEKLADCMGKERIDIYDFLMREQA